MTKHPRASIHPPAPADRHVFTVSKLTALVKERLETAFVDLWVEGEISNLRIPPSGHLYFSLKDRDSQIRAVIFRASGRRIAYAPEDGKAVLAHGRLTVYEPRGDYQLIIDYLEPVGLGALQAAFDQLKERLAAEGLFDPARKRALPTLPQSIGIVTSPTGAAIRDMLTILNRRFANLHVLIAPVPVQGEGAAARIAAAIDDLNDLGTVDVIIIGRGGGSLEDLWAFNEEVVARAIARSRIPVVSAVGHETDFTIADFVADLRAPTPSAAAELVVRAKADWLGQLGELSRRLELTVRLRVVKWRDRVREERRALVDPTRAVEAALLRLDDVADRLRAEMRRALGARRERAAVFAQRLGLRAPMELVRRSSERTVLLRDRLIRQFTASGRAWRAKVGSLAAQLEGLSPLAILARGYSIARRLPDGAIVRAAQTMRVGGRLRLRLHRGELTARVEEIVLPPEESADSGLQSSGST